MTDEELLQKYPNGPRNLEEAIDIVKNSDEMQPHIETASGLTTIVTLCEAKGLFTEEEYEKALNYCKEQVINKCAETLLQGLERIK